MLESLLSPSVLLGIIAVSLIGAGIGVMSTSPPEYSGARVCFGTAYFLIIAVLYRWVIIGEPSRIDVATAFLCSLGIGVLWLTADNWVVTRRVNDPDTKRRTQRETLTKYVLEGGQVRQVYKSMEIVPRATKEEWEAKVFIYLRDNLGSEYAAQFIRRPDPTQQIWNVRPPDMPEENYKMLLVIDMRLAQLEAVIRSLMD